MEELYLSYYNTYSQKYGQNTCIFLEVGKFYEMYDTIDNNSGNGKTSMKNAVELLNIQLKYKENNQIFAGFPTQSVQKFASILTKEGWTVVIVDQVKDIQDKVIERKVSHIYSPGTHIEAFSNDAIFVSCLLLEETSQAPNFSVSSVDISTGKCISYSNKLEGKYDSWNFDTLLHFLQVHPTRELLLLWKGDILNCPKELFFKQNLSLHTTLIHIKHFELNYFSSSIIKENLLNSYFKNRSLLSIYSKLEIVQNSVGEYSLLFLLNFIQDHFPSCKQTFDHSIWKPENSVYLGNNVLNQLNILSQNECILSMFQKTFTSMGKRAMYERILYPISNISELNKRVSNLESTIDMDSSKKQTIEFCLKQICDLPRVHNKFFNYSINGTDILMLDQSYSRVLQIMNILQYTNMEKIKTYYEQFISYFDLENAKLGSEEYSFLNKSHAPKSYEIQQTLQEQKKKANEYLQKILQFANLTTDSMRFEEKESNIYHIESTRKSINILEAKLNSTPRDKWPLQHLDIHIKKTGASLSSQVFEDIHKATFYYRVALKEAIKKELPPICNELCDTFKDIWSEVDIYIAEKDILFTLSKVCIARNFTKPVYKDNSEYSSLDIKGLRHPLIEQQNTRFEYVKHDVCLDKSGWLLYGMNASGKSSLMKAVGICTLLAQVGCYVPATSLILRPYKGIYTRILNQDNIWAGLSSFAVEMLELREILKHATQYSLVLGDELCSGTESVSATALVASGLVWLHSKHTSFIFATHLHSLNNLQQIKNLDRLKTYHLKVHYDVKLDRLIYDRNLEEGSGSSYYGLEVAKAMNIPHEFLEMAHKIRKELLQEKETVSTYNKDCIVKCCELCGSTIHNTLEVHHIQHQKEANERGFLNNGTHKDHIRNLIVLCETCHNKQHNGTSQILQMKATSDGGIIDIKDIKDVKEETKYHEYQDIIFQYIQKYSRLTPKRLCFELETKEDIQVSEQQIRKFRKLVSSSSSS